MPMKARLFAMTSGDIIQNSPISLSLELHDETTGQTIQDITWRVLLYIYSYSMINLLRNKDVF